MKIILVRPNFKSHIITPPLGLGYLASYLKKHHIKTKIIDGLKENLHTDALVKTIISQKPDAIGITCLTAFYNEVVSLSNALRAASPKTKIIIGGVHPTFLPAQTLADSQADYVICGEGEIALLKLAQNHFINRHIQGVYSSKNLNNGKPIKKAKSIANLDDLPFPDWKQLDPRTYPKAPHGAIAKSFPIGIIMTTRGCPYRCSFCASRRFYDQRIRFRSPQNVIREIKYLIRHFGVKEIHFEDDNLTLKRDHVEAICHLIIKNHLKFNWACPNGIRADKVDGPLIKLMKQAGCYFFAFGIESASPKILKNINKLESIDTIKKSIEIARQAGIESQGFFIFGLPGETKATIKESINFAKTSRLNRAHFMILDIIPGSELWDQLQGQFTPNWKKDSYKEPEWIPKGLTKQYLMDAQTQAIRQFYLRPSALFGILKSVKPQQIKYLIQRIIDYRLIKI